MSPELLNVIKEFGFPALVSLALGWFIVHIMKQHREERAIDRSERKEISATASVATEKLAVAVTSLEIHLKGGN